MSARKRLCEALQRFPQKPSRRMLHGIPRFLAILDTSNKIVSRRSRKEKDAATVWQRCFVRGTRTISSGSSANHFRAGLTTDRCGRFYVGRNESRVGDFLNRD